MSNQQIKRLPLTQKQKIVDFLNENWGSHHPLVNNDTLFSYYYVDGQWTNFYYLEDEGEIAAVCGYIKCSEKQDSDIWISIWCAKKGKNGLGLSLMGKMQELTGAKVICCNNIRKNTMAFYTFLGYHPDQLNHYYRLRDQENYRIALVKNKNILDTAKKENVTLRPFISLQEVQNHFNIPTNLSPQKDLWYVEKRYFNYPYYHYHVYGVMENNQCVALVVFRVQPTELGNVLRLVDFIGSPENFHLLSGEIDFLLSHFDCEYCDMYAFGVSGESAGFCLRTQEDSNIIPNYLAPIAMENTDYYFFTSCADNFTMFKADGDQDRKNLG